MSSVTQRPIPGGWAEREFVLSAQRFRLVLPADPDQFLEQLDTAAPPGREAPDPFWARLWPCATPTAEAVWRAAWKRGVPALEIGCGVGLVGLAALARGLSVTFSDRIALAVAVALENARRNGFRRARGLLLDWSSPRAEQYPVILGSDLLYDATQHLPLLGLLTRMLQPDGVCWLGDPGRYHARAFLQRAAERGFAVRLCDETGAEICTPQSGSFQLIVLNPRRKDERG